MFLRFVCLRAVEGMHAREGLFQTAGDLVQDPMMPDFMIARIDVITTWFSTHLERPETFSKSTSKRSDPLETKGLSWFKPCTQDHLARAFELKRLAEENGHTVEVLKERRVGYVVYEDAHQIVAEPFTDT